MKTNLIVLFIILFGLQSYSQHIKEKELSVSINFGVTKTGVFEKYKLQSFPNFSVQSNINYLTGNKFKIGFGSGLNFDNIKDQGGINTNYLYVPTLFLMSFGGKFRLQTGVGTYTGFLISYSAPFSFYPTGFEEINKFSFGILETVSMSFKIKNKHRISLWVQNKHDLTTQYKQARATVTSPDTYFIAVKTYSLGFGLGYQYVLKNKFFEK